MPSEVRLPLIYVQPPPPMRACLALLRRRRPRLARELVEHIFAVRMRRTITQYSNVWTDKVVIDDFNSYTHRTYATDSPIPVRDIGFHAGRFSIRTSRLLGAWPW